MLAVVCFQVAQLRECMSANSADVWLFAGVYPFMDKQGGPMGKIFPTRAALMTVGLPGQDLLFLTVRPLVKFKVIWRRECLGALVALQG